jgi:hypothetical protein
VGEVVSPVETVAAVVIFKTPPEEARMELAGKDCPSIEDALGHLREFLATNDQPWIAACIHPGVTIASLMAEGGPDNRG